MGKALYSAAHDRDNQPERRPRRSGSRISYTPTPEPNPTPTAGDPTEEQRRQLRQAQLRQGVLRDRDLLPDHRRRYEDSSGEVYHSEPRHRGPRMDLRTKAITLPGDQDLEHIDPDLANPMQRAQWEREQLAQQQSPQPPVTAGQGRIAEISLTDQAIVTIDTTLTDVFRNARNLHTAVQLLARRLRHDEDPQLRHSSERMLWIVLEAIEPWLQEVDNHLQEIIDHTTEQQESEEPDEDDQRPTDTVPNGQAPAGYQNTPEDAPKR
jgi:hypothetical protein